METPGVELVAAGLLGEEAAERVADVLEAARDEESDGSEVLLEEELELVLGREALGADLPQSVLPLDASVSWQ